MTPAAFRAALARLGLSQGRVAKRWGVSRRTLTRWCAPDGEPPPWVADALAGIAAEAIR